MNTSSYELDQIPNQLRWDPFDFDHNVDWVRGIHLVAGAGDPTMKTGLAIYVFAAGKDMGKEAFYSADGDFLIVAQHGVLDIQTELGRLLVRANEIRVIPRGIRYHVKLPEGPARGYICEIFSGHFQLPELGPIGSNGLANVRDFQIPTANVIVRSRDLEVSDICEPIRTDGTKLWELEVTREDFTDVSSCGPLW